MANFTVLGVKPKNVIVNSEQAKYVTINGTRVWQKAETYSVNGVSTVAISAWTYGFGEQSSNTSTFQLYDHSSVSFSISCSQRGNYRNDYAPQGNSYVMLKDQTGNTIMKSGTCSTIFGPNPYNGQFDVSGLIGTFYLQLYCQNRTQNINNLDGQTQYAECTSTLKNISVNAQ